MQKVWGDRMVHAAIWLISACVVAFFIIMTLGVGAALLGWVVHGGGWIYAGAIVIGLLLWYNNWHTNTVAKDNARKACESQVLSQHIDVRSDAGWNAYTQAMGNCNK